LLLEIQSTLKPYQLPQFKSSLDDIVKGGPNFDENVKKLKGLIGEKAFGIFVELLPPTYRLHLALRFRLKLPKIDVDFLHLSVPIEFLQALADVNGRDNAFGLIWYDGPFSKLGIVSPDEVAD
jgi:hypothetical protein